MKIITLLLAELATWCTPLLIWVAKFSPYHHLKNKDGTPYMNRYWLIYPRWFTLGCGVRVHHIRSSDDDRALHDHPWSFSSVILRGGYFEVLSESFSHTHAAYQALGFPGASMLYENQTRKWVVGYFRQEGEVNSKKLNGWPWHRLRLLKDLGITTDETWTLFITGPYTNDWGFLVAGTKVDRRKYLRLPAAARLRIATEKTYGQVPAQLLVRKLTALDQKSYGGTD